MASNIFAVFQVINGLVGLLSQIYLLKHFLDSVFPLGFAIAQRSGRKFSAFSW